MRCCVQQFPFLFGGTFIEAKASDKDQCKEDKFPFLFGGTFIEARGTAAPSVGTSMVISLPFRRDFH